MLDRLILTGMVFYGRHGVRPAERELGNRFTVDVELEADLSEARRSDWLQDTINYSTIYQFVAEEVEGEPCQLLEALADRILTRILGGQPQVARALVRIHKRPTKQGEFQDFAVEVRGGNIS
jgi:7,8-dihydroneopterin aldolase/epimerase/oxygenase